MSPETKAKIEVAGDAYIKQPLTPEEMEKAVYAAKSGDWETIRSLIKSGHTSGATYGYNLAIEELQESEAQILQLKEQIEFMNKNCISLGLHDSRIKVLEQQLEKAENVIEVVSESETPHYARKYLRNKGANG
jgi:hypothetical protein